MAANSKCKWFAIRSLHSFADHALPLNSQVKLECIVEVSTKFAIFVARYGRSGPNGESV